MTEPEKTCLLAGKACFDGYETQGPGLSPNCAKIHPEAWRVAFETNTQLYNQILKVIDENSAGINNDKPGGYVCVTQDIVLRGTILMREIIEARKKDNIASLRTPSGTSVYALTCDPTWDMEALCDICWDTARRLKYHVIFFDAHGRFGGRR